MKKLVSLLLALLLAMTAVLAEAPSAATTLESRTETQDFYVDVVVEFAQVDDSITTVPLRIRAFTATYRYDIIRDAQTGELAGFSYSPTTFITLSELTFEEDELPNFNQFLLEYLDLQFGNIVLPEHFEIHQSPGSDSIWIAFDGTFEVIYNTKLFLDCYDGTLIDATEGIVKFDYTFSGEDG